MIYFRDSGCADIAPIGKGLLTGLLAEENELEFPQWVRELIRSGHLCKRIIDFRRDSTEVSQ